MFLDICEGISYFDGDTTDGWDDLENNGKGVGTLDKTMCADPCICSDTACYKLNPDDPAVSLYPHCETPMTDCYIAVILNSPGELVNVDDATDTFTSDNQVEMGTYDLKGVEDADAYLRATQIGCAGCPVI
uniref:Uncharacterized protein n=1 Tax=Panagrolaimus sp. ES5 TaxID=591445 RepID=A0AC34GIV4_9BILA